MPTLRFVLPLLASALLLASACSSYRPARDQLEAGSYRVVNSTPSDFEVELTHPAKLATLDVPSGSRVTFDGPNLKAITLSQPCLVLGHTFPAKTTLELAFGGYYAGTQLHRAKLGGPDASGRSALRAGDVVTIDGAGRIRSAVLDGPHTFDGTRFADGDHVTFDDGGAVRSRMSSAEAAQASERSAKASADERRERQLSCALKCGPNTSCKDHCMKYGY